MKLEKLKTETFLPISLDEAWDFFSVPDNLNEITPEDMSFAIESKSQDGPAYAGMIITYTVKPLLNIPMYWVTEITQVEEKKMFIDEQRFGPYAFWHHEHHFESVPGGVKMTDVLYYKVPFGLLGTLVNSIMVRKKVQGIFSFREEKLKDLFPGERK
jgi:ligand-binding SRPBCC domain-containing protein